MARRTTLTVKVTDNEKDDAAGLAAAAGLFKLDGTPNVSALVRLLIHDAAEEAKREAAKASPFL